MYQTIALKFGYVESMKASWLIYTNNYVKIKTKEEALVSLAKMLYDYYLSRVEFNNDSHNKHKLHMARCCQKNWQKDSTLTNCPTCKADYSTKYEAEFSYDEWIDFLLELSNSDCDSYGYDDTHQWVPWEFGFDVPTKKNCNSFRVCRRNIIYSFN